MVLIMIYVEIFIGKYSRKNPHDGLVVVNKLQRFYYMYKDLVVRQWLTPHCL